MLGNAEVSTDFQLRNVLLQPQRLARIHTTKRPVLSIVCVLFWRAISVQEVSFPEPNLFPISLSQDQTSKFQSKLTRKRLVEINWMSQGCCCCCCCCFGCVCACVRVLMFIQLRNTKHTFNGYKISNTNVFSTTNSLLFSVWQYTKLSTTQSVLVWVCLFFK